MSDFQLVDSDFVGGCIGADTGCPEWKILEAHFSSIDHPELKPASERRHISGALEIHPSYLEAGCHRERYYPNYNCPADGNLLPIRELQIALENIGITPETPVVIYRSEPDGTMAAARVAWGLLYAGVETVRLLDGGLTTWIKQGGVTVATIADAAEVGRRPDSLSTPCPSWKVRSELLATTTEVREIALFPETVSAKLVDVRTRGEWNGSCTRHHPFFSTAGHIPNAIFQGDWDTLVDRATHQIAPRLDEVAARWRQLGILDQAVERGDTTLVFCCGTGWRSSISFLEAKLLGLNARNYDDGFYGWSCGRREDLIEAG